MLPTQVETYPLTDPAFLEDPYPVYHRMRQQDPVYWSEALGHWVLTRYDDVLAATRNPALSSARTEVFVRAQLRGSDPALAADYTRIHSSMMIMKDGPEHHRLRVLGNHAFTPSALRRWQAVIERVVDDLLEGEPIMRRASWSRQLFTTRPAAAPAWRWRRWRPTRRRRCSRSTPGWRRTTAWASATSRCARPPPKQRPAWVGRHPVPRHRDDPTGGSPARPEYRPRHHRPGADRLT